jgi:hypothetical protein
MNFHNRKSNLGDDESAAKNVLMQNITNGLVFCLLLFAVFVLSLLAVV